MFIIDAIGPRVEKKKFCFFLHSVCWRQQNHYLKETRKVNCPLFISYSYLLQSILFPINEF